MAFHRLLIGRARPYNALAMRSGTNRYRFERVVTLAIASSLSCVFALPASALDAGVELRIGGTHSDNVGRANTDEEDQVIGTAGIAFDVSGESRRSEGSIDADIAFREYFDDAFDSETLPKVTADLTLKPVPDRFHWVTEARYDQTRQDPFEPTTPDNREDVGSFSTGPDFLFRFSPKTSAQVGGRYSAALFEESDTDSDTLSATLTLTRALSSNRSISLNGSGGRVEYDSDGGLSDFERYSAFIGFDSQISKGTLSLQIGANEVKSDGARFSGTLAGLSWNRQISAISNVSLSLNQRYSDAGDFFSSLDSVFQQGSDSSVIPTRDPFETLQVSGGYGYSKGRLTLSANVSVSEDDFESETSFDSRRLTGSFGGSVSLTNGWSTGFSLRYQDREFDLVDRTDEYLTGTLNLGKELGRNLALSFEYRFEDRESTQNGEDYTENQFSITLRYSPGR